VELIFEQGVAIMMKRFSALLGTSLLLPIPLKEDVILPTLLADHMVVRRVKNCCVLLGTGHVGAIASALAGRTAIINDPVGNERIVAFGFGDLDVPLSHAGGEVQQD
jgi:glutamate mutase epsilon subunit